MKYICVAAAIAVIACEVTKPADVPTTTSASLHRDGPYTSSHGPNLSDEPAPLDPRIQRDLDIAARAAQERDVTISTAVREAILHDANLPPDARRHVDVTTFARKVTLRGHVRTRSERQEIELNVREVTDVLDIDDRIEIAP